MQYSVNKEEGVSILLAALQERYLAQHAIRERVQNIGVWAMGLLLATGSWIIQNQTELNCLKKAIYIIGIICAFTVLRFKYLADLQKGFKSQQQITVKLEKALGLFTPALFDNEKEAIYPKTWENAGTGNGDGEFFKTTHLLLYVGVVFLLVTILLSGNR